MRPETVEKRAQETRFSLRRRANIASSPRGLIRLITTSFLGMTRQLPGFAWKCSLLRSHFGTTQVSRGLALLYIISTNIYLGFDITSVSFGAVSDTLIPRGEGTKTLIVGRTGKRFITPFRGVVESHIERDTATFDANRRWFFHPPLPGGLGQKLQLRLIAWCNCFEVSGHYLGIYLTWTNTLPAFSRLIM